MIRKKNQNQTIAFVVTLLIIVLVLIFQTPVRSFFYTISKPIQTWFTQGGENSSDFFEGLFSFLILERENDELRQENILLLSRIVELNQLKEENEKLRSAFEFGLTEKYDLLVANVISKDIDQDFILVDKKEGIEPGMLVIDFSNVLVGKVSEIYGDQAKVMLITHRDMKLSAEIEGKQINGLIKGQGGKVILDLVPKEEELTRDALISTAGLGEGLERGLLIGRIGDIEKTDLTAFQKAEIDMFLQVSKLNEVLIILNQ